MISEMTEELVRDHFLLREVDSIRVVGKQKPVKIYQLLDTIENHDSPEHDRWTAMVESFYRGLEAYKNQDWEMAVALFEKHVEMFPEDPVGGIYLGRCHSFVTAPPAGDWDGVIQMETK
jgi:adenylate cyclase